MTKTPIHTDHAPKAIGPYSQAVAFKDMLFLSGQIPLDPETMTVVSTDIEEQTHRVFKNLEAVLHEAHLTFSDMVQLTIYLTDLNDFVIVNQVMEHYFKPPYPARATVQVSRLPKDVNVEISAIAIQSRA